MIHAVHEDNHLLAVNKPAGELTQGDAGGEPCLVDRAKSYIKEKYGKPGAVFLVPAHRLDRPVSGLLLLARTGKAASRLARQFRDRLARKWYHAVVELEKDLVDMAEGRVWSMRNGFWPGTDGASSRVVRSGSAGSRIAELELTVVRRQGGRALLEVRPLTGYKHQIRAQLAWAGMPVAGDHRYGPRGRPARPVLFGKGRAVALHASRLDISHPVGGKTVRLEAAWPPEFVSLATLDQGS